MVNASGSEVPNPVLGAVKEGIIEEVTLGRSQRSRSTHQAERVGNSTTGIGNSMCKGTETEGMAGVAQTQVCGLGSGRR